MISICVSVIGGVATLYKELILSYATLSHGQTREYCASAGFCSTTREGSPRRNTRVPGTYLKRGLTAFGFRRNLEPTFTPP